MGYAAKVIALDEIRASQKRQALRHQLHERFDQWLDELERQLPGAELTLSQVSETIWELRQPLTASVAQTIVLSTAIKKNTVAPICTVRRVSVC